MGGSHIRPGSLDEEVKLSVASAGIVDTIGRDKSFPGSERKKWQKSSLTLERKKKIFSQIFFFKMASRIFKSINPSSPFLSCGDSHPQ